MGLGYLPPWSRPTTRLIRHVPSTVPTSALLILERIWMGNSTNPLCGGRGGAGGKPRDGGPVVRIRSGMLPCVWLSMSFLS
jgi:hypothetical protein